MRPVRAVATLACLATMLSMAMLAPGGVLIYETFMLGNEAYGKPSNPAFLLRPGELRDVVRAAGLHEIDFVEGYVDSPKPAVRQAIETAWFEQQPVTIHYDGARGPTTRTIRIDRIVLERSLTLLNAVDLEDGAARQFRLDRVTQAQVPHAAHQAASRPRVSNRKG